MQQSGMQPEGWLLTLRKTYQELSFKKGLRELVLYSYADLFSGRAFLHHPV